MRPIFLVGYMGSGKSTLGVELGKYLGCRFYDLDNYIEGRYRKSVKQIFAEYGEEGFRDRERRLLQEVSDFEDIIIACGGGTPCFFDNMDIMSAKGVTVWLKPSRECLVHRLSIPTAKAKRPLIANLSDEELKAFICEALDKREPFYSKANITFDSGHLESKRDLADSTRELGEILRKYIH